MTQESNANLASIEAIRQLKARYCRLVDTKEWAQLKQQLTDDARLEGFGTIDDGVSPTAFVDALTDILASAVTIHHVHNPEIQILGEDYARGIWAMVDYVQFANVSEHAGGNLGWVGWGYYEEEYAKVLATGAFRTCVSSGCVWMSFARTIRSQAWPHRADAGLVVTASPEQGIERLRSCDTRINRRYETVAHALVERSAADTIKSVGSCQS